MKTPIIVYNSGDVCIFESVRKATSYLEPIDVNNGEYVAYDSEGRLLRLSTQFTKGTFLRGSFEIVVLDAAEEQPNHAAQVREILIKYLGVLSVNQKWLLKASLEELAEKSLDYKTS